MEKIKIEPGTVQETLLIPLYGRKQAMDRYPDIFMDHDCQGDFLPRRLSGIRTDARQDWKNRFDHGCHTAI